MSDLSSLVLSSRGLYDEIISRQQNEIAELNKTIEHYKRNHRKNLESIHGYLLDRKYAHTPGPFQLHVYPYPKVCMSCLSDIFPVGEKESVPHYQMLLESPTKKRSLKLCYDCSNFLFHLVGNIAKVVYIIHDEEYKCLFAGAIGYQGNRISKVILAHNDEEG